MLASDWTICQARLAVLVGRIDDEHELPSAIPRELRRDKVGRFDTNFCSHVSPRGPRSAVCGLINGGAKPLPPLPSLEQSHQSVAVRHQVWMVLCPCYKGSDRIKAWWKGKPNSDTQEFSQVPTQEGPTVRGVM